MPTRIVRIVHVRSRPAWWRGWFRPSVGGGRFVPVCRCQSEQDAHRVLAGYPPGQRLVLPADAKDPNSGA
jgi:hypothetical protein